MNFRDSHSLGFHILRDNTFKVCADKVSLFEMKVYLEERFIMAEGIAVTQGFPRMVPIGILIGRIRFQSR